MPQNPEYFDFSRIVLEPAVVDYFNNNLTEYISNCRQSVGNEDMKDGIDMFGVIKKYFLQKTPSPESVTFQIKTVTPSGWKNKNFSLDINIFKKKSEFFIGCWPVNGKKYDNYECYICSINDLKVNNLLVKRITKDGNPFYTFSLKQAIKFSKYNFKLDLKNYGKNEI